MTTNAPNLRPATDADSERLSAVRNEQVTVRFSRSGVRTREDLEEDCLHKPDE